MSNLDDRIAAALRAAANQVTDADLAPAAPPTSATVGRPRRPIRWIAPVIAAAAVAGIAISVTAVVDHHPQASKTAPPGVTNSATMSTAPPPTVNSSPNGSVEMVCYFADASPCKVPAGFVWYVPLWPFNNYDAVKQWQASSGSQPWHLDPAQTALLFTQNYLGFHDITRVTSTSVTADQAKIGVGYLNPAGQPVTAAVLHLVRYEQYPDTKTAPWEVVGSEDTTLSLESPAYDSTVGPSFTAAGHMTGVDENLHLWVRAYGSANALVDDCCLPSGGNKQPWSRKVNIPTVSGFGPARSGAVMIVVSTGGHVQQHERFAIQGVYIRIPSS